MQPIDSLILGQITRGQPLGVGSLLLLIMGAAAALRTTFPIWRYLLEKSWSSSAHSAASASNGNGNGNGVKIDIARIDERLKAGVETFYELKGRLGALEDRIRALEIQRGGEDR